MKYAAIPINRRINPEGVRDVRYILISYVKKSKDMRYLDTHVIDFDEYFKNPNSSHKYLFTDEGFSLIKTYEFNYGDPQYEVSDSILLNRFRPYSAVNEYLMENPVEFQARDDEEAKIIFKQRTFLE